MTQQLHRCLRFFWLTILICCSASACGENSPRQVDTQTSSPSTEAVRVVKHAMGTAEVPVIPQRVIAMGTAPLDAAIALGVQPIGASYFETFPKYLEKNVENIEDIVVIGSGHQPDFETVLELKPDLILGSEVLSEYKLLSQIAPTVFTKVNGRLGEWQQNFQLYAEALGKSKLAQQLLEDYEQRVEQLRQKITSPETITISVLISYDDRFSVYTTGSFSGSVLQDVGFSRPPAQDITRTYGIDLSAEAFNELDGNYIFLIEHDLSIDQISKQELITHPLWSQLDAVQQDRVCEVTSEVWTTGRNFLAANQILEDVERCLT